MERPIQSLAARSLSKTLAAAAAGAAMLAGAASAQPPAAPEAPEVPALAPGQARAEGEALLAQAQAADLFDNLTGEDSAEIRLKHKASGLICVFNPAQPSNRVVVLDGPARGDEIACSTGGAVGERTVYAARAPGQTLDAAFAADVALVKRSHADIRDYSLPPDTDSPVLQMLDVPPMPPSRTARFIAEHQFTSVSTAIWKDWRLTFRFTCSERAQDLAAGTLQPTLWVTILAQISGAPLDLVAPKQAV